MSAAAAVPSHAGTAPAPVAGFFTRQAPAIRAALKTTLGCVLVTMVIMTIHVPHEAWALITVIVLSAPEIGASLQKGTLRLAGTVTGASLGVVMIDLFSQYPVAFSAVFFCVCAFASYMATGPRFPYAYLIGLVTLNIVAVQALNRPYDAESIALARCAEVMLGVMATILVTLSLWPVRSSDRLHERLAKTIADCRTVLTTSPLAAGTDAVITRLLSAPMEQKAFLEVARTERDVSGPRYERLRRATELSARVIDATLVADATCRFAGRPGPVLPAAPADPGASLLQQLEGLTEALRWRPPAGAVPDGPHDPVASAAIAAGVGDLTRHVEALARRTPHLGVRPMPGHADVAAADDDLLLSTQKERWPDPVRLLHACKVALAVQVGLWLWAMFHLPAGMQAMVTILLVSQKTLGASELRSSLRLAGALVGGTIGILVASLIIPLMSSLAAFLLVIAPIIFVCIWVNDGSKRYGYAGFQAAFAFILTLVGGASPMPDVLAPIERFIGICVGVVIALIVMRSIAPVDAPRGALGGIARLLEASGIHVRGLLERIAAGTPTPRDVGWAAALAAARDESVTHLSELRDGTGRPRQLAAHLDPLFNLVSRFAAVVSVLDRTASTMPPFPRELAGAELIALGRALETATHRLADAVRRREAPVVDAAPRGALRSLEEELAAAATAELAPFIGRLRTCVALLDPIALGAAEPPSGRAAAAILRPAVSG